MRVCVLDDFAIIKLFGDSCDKWRPVERRAGSRAELNEDQRREVSLGRMIVVRSTPKTQITDIRRGRVCENESS